MSDAEDPTPLLDAAYAVRTPEDNRQLYRRWAQTYDDDFVAATAYVYHHNVAQAFVAGAASTAGPVLDVGCGTGAVGVALRAQGVDVVDGIDISPEMLTAAGAKTDHRGSVYRNLIEADLTKPIDMADGLYGGVVSAGAFTHGHLGPDAMNELLRVAGPGARFALGINANHFDEFGFGARFEQWAGDGTIGHYRVEEAIVYRDADDDNRDHFTQIAVFTRT